MENAITVRLTARDMRSGRVLQLAVDRLPLTIGRHPDNGFQLEHETVSRFHATLEWHDARLVLTDLGSCNKTHYRGFALTPFEPEELADEFLFAVGPFVVSGRVSRPLVGANDAATRAVSVEEMRRLLPDDDAVTVVRRIVGA
jgi:pSer/pThr/pTyr-binding forkhead associated (FHA) protein